MCGFIAQLIEQRTGNAEVTGSNPVEARIFFFRLLLCNCLNWKKITAMIILHFHYYPYYNQTIQKVTIKLLFDLKTGKA